MKKIIKWDKWANPLTGDREYIEVGGGGDAPPEFDDHTEKMVIPVIPTAAGLMPLHVYSQFSINFTFYILHTNFNLSRQVQDILKDVPGVEILDIITRYRARIGIARCFDEENVRQDIEKALGVNETSSELTLSLDRNTKERVKLLQKMANEKYKYWAIYIIPNGELALTYADTINDFKQRLQLYEESQELAGGTIISNL